MPAGKVGMELLMNRDGDIVDPDDYQAIELPEAMAQAILDNDFEALKDAVIQEFS